MFNALKYIKSLEAVGFLREQAEAQVQLVMDAMKDELATKADIAEIRSDFATLRSEFSELKGNFSDLRGEFSEFKVEIILRLGGLMVACTTAATGILGFLIKF